MGDNVLEVEVDSLQSTVLAYPKYTYRATNRATRTSTNGGSEERTLERHACLGQDQGIDDQDVGHREERRQLGFELGPDGGLMLPKLEDAFEDGQEEGRLGVRRPPRSVSRSLPKVPSETATGKGLAEWRAPCPALPGEGTEVVLHPALLEQHAVARVDQIGRGTDL